MALHGPILIGMSLACIFVNTGLFTLGMIPARHGLKIDEK
jgi:hypothetical protein